MRSMTVLRCQFVLNPSDESRHQVMNTFHITDKVTSTPVDAAIEFAADLNIFYQSADTWLSTEFAGKTPLFSAWDLSDPKPRQPVWQATQSVLNPSGTNVGPRELACCISYRGAYVSGENPQSRRGRFYFGPLIAGAMNTTSGLIDGAVVTGLATAADALLAAAAGADNYVWVVYSRKLDPTGVGAPGSYTTVTSGWVDNNVDIQRRRQSPTRVKTTFV